MASSSHGGKIALFIIVALVGGFAGFGYFNQTANLDAKAKEEAAKPGEPVVDRSLLAPKPNDIILGDVNALITVVEYSSLSCPHCANFHQTVLPALEKEFITPGKVRLVVRHFPLNEPAIKAAEVVECAGSNGLKRESFLKVLFSMQPQWAFGDSFLKDLKQIALVGGMDSATFDSCMADKALETRILTTRQEAETQLNINSTPTFFINGDKMEGDVSIENFRKALAGAGSGKK
ncbi:MAG: DsbA family protein [Pseudomonadota bacterium]